jgi:hypothetical protein
MATGNSLALVLAKDRRVHEHGGRTARRGPSKVHAETRIEAFAPSRQHDDLALHLVMSRSAQVVALELACARGAGGKRDLLRLAFLKRIAMEFQAFA